MSVSRLYQPIDLHVGAEVLLNAEASHYLLHVLRFNVGDFLHVFNGQGGEYRAKVIAIQKKQVIVFLHEFLNIERESALNLHLGQGLARGDRMDYAIQKAVELGVTQITPLITAHCAVKLQASHLASRMTHWEKIIISACEQCGRNRLPTLHPVTPLTTWASQNPMAATSLVLSPTATSHLTDLSRPATAVRVLIGPEGGLHEDELAYCRQYDFTLIHLGPRILRTETAATATLAALQTLWGDS